MKSLDDFINEALEHVDELFPWDLEDALQEINNLLLLDVREPWEYDAMHIRGAINVPVAYLKRHVNMIMKKLFPSLSRPGNGILS